MDTVEFKGRIADPASALEQLDNGAKVGEIDVEVAVYGVPDTGRPYGVNARQVIDHGAFAPAIEELKGRALPYFVDHGHIQAKGFVDSEYKIGKADKLREEQNALVFRGLVNLRTQRGHDTFANMLFDPENSPHSFRWNDEVTVRGEDGFDHVTAFDQLMEVSSVGRGAQMATGIRKDTALLRSAIGPHSTETYDGSWDGPGMVARMPNDASSAMLHKMFAWVDPQGDPTAKSSYKFAHHTFTNGSVDGANVEACRAIIANLNGARSAPNIPSSDRAGVYAHAARHLRDAGETPAPLRATIEEIRLWVGEDHEFADALREMVGGDVKVIEEPSRARTWLDELVEDEMRKDVVQMLRSDSDAREILRRAIEDAEAPSPVFQHYEILWRSRA